MNNGELRLSYANITYGDNGIDHVQVNYEVRPEDRSVSIVGHVIVSPEDYEGKSQQELQDYVKSRILSHLNG